MTKASARADGATVLRSGGSFVLGILGSGFLLLLAVLFGWSRPVATGLALLGAAACHLLLTHPHVRLDEHAVTLANPVRWVRIPWGLLDEVTARLSLDVFTETQKFTSWAVSAKLERPTPSPGLPSSRDPGLAAASVARAPEGAATRAGEGAAMRGGSMTAQRAKQLIEQAHGEWQELVAAAAVPAPAQPAVALGWEWRNVGLLAVGAVVTVVGLLT